MLRDEASLERSKLVVGLAGGAVNGAGPNAVAFIPVWSVVQNSLARLQAALSAEEPAEETVRSSRRRRRKPAQ